jgi:hypothetical protein
MVCQSCGGSHYGTCNFQSNPQVRFRNTDVTGNVTFSQPFPLKQLYETAETAETAEVEEAAGSDPEFKQRIEATCLPLPTGSEERKGIPLWSGLFRYFPNALAEVAKVSKLGNDKHNPGEDLHWARGKSMDQEDCILRHMHDAEFGYRDKDGMFHLAYMAWRALAYCQLALEKEAAGK